MPNNSVRTSNQLDGANDEMTTEQKKNVKRSNRKQKIEVSFQVDGTGPPVCHLRSISFRSLIKKNDLDLLLVDG